MGFLDWVTGKIECPRCGTKGASEEGGQIRCPNPACAYFDSSLAGGGVTQQPVQPTFNQGSFVPAGSLAVRYRNFRKEEKTFIAEVGSAQRDKNHISVKVAPKGMRIVLSRDRIQNLSEVESAFPQRVAPGQAWPTPRERQILNYHKKRHSSSPLYESLRAKYPNW
jgi:hypothetical protein